MRPRTVNPYLGIDGVRPFVEAATESGRSIFVLVKTSNPSSADVQDLSVQTDTGGKLLYQHIGDLVARWGEGLIGECGYSAVGAVVGATYPGQLAELRSRLPQVPFLVPGPGASYSLMSGKEKLKSSSLQQPERRLPR